MTDEELIARLPATRIGALWLQFCDAAQSQPTDECNGALELFDIEAMTEAAHELYQAALQYEEYFHANEDRVKEYMAGEKLTNVEAAQMRFRKARAALVNKEDRQ